MNAIRSWFGPANRERLYTAIAALAPILVTAGIVLPGQVEPILAIVAAALQGFAGILALTNLKPTEAARWFGTVGRGVIYTGATGVAAAVVALGLVTGDWANTALQYTSFGLTALAAILAVITPKEVVFDKGEIAPIEAVVVEDAVVEADSLVLAEGTVTSANVGEVAEAPVSDLSVESGPTPVKVEEVHEEVEDDEHGRY